MLSSAIRRRTLLVAAALAAAVFSVAAVFALDAPRVLDARLVGWIAARRAPGPTDLSHLMATLGSSRTLVPLSTVLVAFLLVLGRFRAALLLAVAMVAEVLLNPALKDLFGLPRPSGELAVYEHAEPGFPSGHAMAAATFCAALALIAWPTRWRRVALVAGIAWALLMGLSRMYLGVHWPTDAIGGWAAGVALACGLGAVIGVSPARSPGPESCEPESMSREAGTASQSTGAAVRDAETAGGGAETAGGDAETAAGDAETTAGDAETTAGDAETVDDGSLRIVLFDWGNTLMVDDGQPGAMKDWPHVEAVPGAAEALAALHGRYRLCVATNADDSGAAEVLAALDRVGLARHIDHVFSSRDLGARKPDPAFYAAVLETLRADTAAGDTAAGDTAAGDTAAGDTAAGDTGAGPAATPGEPYLGADQVVMVGDNYGNDVAGALAAGLRAVWLAPDGTPWPDGNAPKRASRIASPAELPGLLRTL